MTTLVHTPAVRRHADSAPPASARLPYLDRLKVLLIAVIIAAHGTLGYSTIEGTWPYQDVQETVLTDVGEGILAMLVLPPVLFVMGLFFLMSGLVTPRSLERKGPERFARDRLVRLGIPLALWVLVLWPTAKAMAHLAAGASQSTPWSQLRNADPLLDAGPMWFVAVLLIYSLAYAWWWRRRGVDTRPAAASKLSGRALVAVAAGISLATLLVRPFFPVASGQVLQIHLWQQPQFIAMFGLGVVAARRGWLNPVPGGLRHACGVTALWCLAAFLILCGATQAAGIDAGDAFQDLRWHWSPLLLAVIEGPLAVSGSVWLLGTAQRRLNEPLSRCDRGLARSSFGAFVLQGVVLLGLAIALRWFDLPAEVKALTVGLLGVVLSYALAWLLVTRTPVRRVL